MVVSKEIQKKMHRLAKLSAEAAALSQEIDSYFQAKGYSVEPYDPDSLRCGNGCSLEELELGNDITDEIVSAIENRRYQPQHSK